jgi:3-oxoadipate enol-lactonase
MNPRATSGLRDDGLFDGTYGRELTIERPGCTIHAWLAGSADAPLVALSHAALVDHTFFAQQVPALLPRYRVLTWDIRGHGASRPLESGFKIPDAVDDLVAILDALGIDAAVMLGQSMGTYIGQEMAYRHPERVAALIVIGGTCITADPGTLGREELRAAGPIMRAWPYRSLKRASVKAAAVESSSRAYLRRCFDEFSKREYIDIMDGVDNCLHPDPDYRTPRPTLLLVGEHDKTGNIRESMAAWAAREPDDEYHVIAGAGHCANLDRPEETNRRIVTFVRRALGDTTREPGFVDLVGASRSRPRRLRE